MDQFKMLADIRFKLLAFVPTLAGAAIAFLTEVPIPETALAIGILGFIVMIGITFYDIHDTQFLRLVPTLRVGTPKRPLCVHCDAERRILPFHAERGARRVKKF